MLKIPILLAAVDGSTSGGGFVGAVTTLMDMASTCLNFLTKEPMVYFVAAGIAGVVFGLIGRAKRSSK